MTEDITITIQLFGGLRQYGDHNPLVLQAKVGDTVLMIKARLQNTLIQSCAHFDGEDLIARSALANETRILTPDEIINTSGILALLPPVCGG